jgi:16S rRNA A1518/A1519 N6-dimethyltransferase RsmA/KsgA/DIM1 with predicted DNA glycosylase/AP lyase activity
MVGMFQKEVAERILPTGPVDKSYGILMFWWVRIIKFTFAVFRSTCRFLPASQSTCQLLSRIERYY